MMYDRTIISIKTTRHCLQISFFTRTMTDSVDTNAKKKEYAKYIRDLGSTEGRLESPINLDISRAKVINLPLLNWINYNVAPRKLKITNTGYTVILSAKWQIDGSPYLNGGPLDGNYVFSQMHFHWGETEMYGSEHSADGASMPMELHIVHFKTQYASQEEALRQTDGIVMVAYLFKTPPNFYLKEIVQSLSTIKAANANLRIVPVVLGNIFQSFASDYLVYWGSIVAPNWTHRIMWLVGREPIGIAKEQIDEFRSLCDQTDKPILRNYRPIKDSLNRHVFHVCPSGSTYATLLPISREQLALSSKIAAETANVITEFL